MTTRQGSGRRGTWLCSVCAREISCSHMKRHLAAHDRHGTPRAATDEEWLAFLDATGWPANLTPAGALLRRRWNPGRSNPRSAMPEPRRSYSQAAGAWVPLATRRRRDRVLDLLRSADAEVTANELVEHLRRNRVRDYNYGLAPKDLHQLERYGLVRCVGHPRRWSAA